MLNFGNPLANLGGPQAHHAHHGHRNHGPRQGNDVKQLLQFMVGMAAGLMASQMLGGAQQQHGNHGHCGQAGFSPQQSPGFGGALNLNGSNLNLTQPQGGQSPFGLQGGQNPFGQKCGHSPFGQKCGNGPAQGQGGQDPQSLIAVGIAIGMAQARQGQAGPQGPGGGLNLTGSNINLVPGGNGDFGRNLSAQHPGGINITGSNVTMGAGDFAAMLGNTRGPINLTGSNINLVGAGQGQPQQGGQSPEALLALGIQLGKAMAQHQQGGAHSHPHPHQQQQTTGAFAIAGVFRTGVGGVLG